MLRFVGKSKKLFSNWYSNSLYKSWLKDPESVSKQWQIVFKSQQSSSQSTSTPANQTGTMRVFDLVKFYKMRGHQLSSLDALNLKNLKEYGKKNVKQRIEGPLANLSDAQKNQVINLPKEAKKIHNFLSEKQNWSLLELQQRLKGIYCGKRGYQFSHLQNTEEKEWFQRQIQKIDQKSMPSSQKLKVFQDITKIQTFNYYLNQKFKTSKRFGVEGVDSFVSGLISLVDQAAKVRMEYIDFGMAHRGRLCTLARLFQKPMQQIFAEFQQLKSGNIEWGNSGDVKYHLGVVNRKKIRDHTVTLSILPNPSHLETVNPVVMGSCKAVQEILHDKDGSKTLNVIIHGDAAVAGQGVVYQSLQMMKLDSFKTYGTIHVVANNQIGFTTTPAQARTGLYCTDVAKAVGAPIIHVNADQPLLVDQLMRLAFNYRMKFKKDVFLDVIGYRRYGHNQQDQPAFTQPLMYKQIEQHQKVYDILKKKLVAQGIITNQAAKTLWDTQIAKLNNSYQQSKKESFDFKKFAGQSFHSLINPSQTGKLKDTGIAFQKLMTIGNKIFNIPSQVTLHPQISKIFENRRAALSAGQGIDFAMAEALAFGSLLEEGYKVRLSGQDVERGTFSHRHAVVVDQKQDKKLCIFQELRKNRPFSCQIHNSLLSQYGCLGFQYGYSLSNPNALIIWEAQFGDFANGAQVIIDNFICSAETKWNIQSGIVLALPHGMDGQGPQHSSGRIQRFLSLSDQDLNSVDLSKPVKRQNLNSNIQVIVPSFSANYFHALRRQMRRLYRKPLITFNSKKLLRFKKAASSKAEFELKRFQTCLPEMSPDQLVKPHQVRKVLVCAGQIYYDLEQHRHNIKAKDVAIIRVEQLAPFPFEAFRAILRPYKNSQVIWVQQQHKNSGGWEYVSYRIDLVIQSLLKQGALSKEQRVQYCGRKISSSTSVGSKAVHDQEHKLLLETAFK